VGRAWLVGALLQWLLLISMLPNRVGPWWVN
jgi:hypothetical protein